MAPSSPRPSNTRKGRPNTPPSPTCGPMLSNWQPYSPRRSSRTTTNPYSTQNTGGGISGTLKPPVTQGVVWHPIPIKSGKKPMFDFTPSDVFSSPPASPAFTASLFGRDSRKHSAVPDTPRRVIDNYNITNDSLNPPSSSSRKAHMLPTPIDTPSMTPSSKHSRAANMQDTARILNFHPENPNDVMPTPRNNRAGSSNSSSAFTIYTESHARVPELDESEENVFYRPRGRARTIPQSRQPSGRSNSTPRPVKSKEQIIEDRRIVEAAARNEGIVFNFRGRKVFHKFADQEVAVGDPSSSDTQRALRRAVGVTADRPITASSIQPRLLFPPANNGDDVDEEAETDVETSEFTPATPAKGKAQSRHAMSPPPTKTYATHKHSTDAVPIFQDTAETMPPSNAFPTPKTISKKVDAFQVYKNTVSEPASPSDNAAPAASQRSTRNKSAAAGLTPIIEDESESNSPDGTSPTSALPGKPGSPFNAWSRTKAHKRPGLPLQGGPDKRNRRGNASDAA